MITSTLTSLHGELILLGAKPAHIRRIWRAWLGRTDWAELESGTPRLPKDVLGFLPELRDILEKAASFHSRYPGLDKESERLLITLSDGKTIESVLLPRQGVCVSSQLGCAVGCRFCMTGRGGLLRQLTDLEIVAQVAVARALRPDTRKVVFMGMGEPSHNREAVLNAVDFLARYGEFGHKNLVVSTVGDKRLFAALEERTIRPALAISLHSVRRDTRRMLLPKAAPLEISDIIAFAGHWAELSGYPVQYEWTLVKGVNDSVEEIDELASLIKGQYAMVNFIPVNAVEGSGCERPEREHCAELVRRLKSRGIVTTLRDSAAQEVDGGCGQLRAREVGLDG